MSSDGAKPIEVEVVEMSGRTHHISELKSTDTVRTLYSKVEASMASVATATSNPSSKIGLVVEDRVLTCTDLDKELQSVGIGNRMMLPLVRVSHSEVFECLGDVGDEDQLGAHSTSKTVVRLAFTSENTCLLIRQTYGRTFTGAFTWDICRGRYSMEGDNVAVCTWPECYRRRRAGVERAGSFGINDSGWIRRMKVPDSWKRITLNSGGWAMQAVMFQEGDGILGIKLFGRGTCAEALRLMAIS